MSKAKRGPNHHYHVLVGLAGLYMPNSNDVYRTKSDALAGAREWAKSFRDDGEKVSGGPEYYRVGTGECIEVTSCDMSDCLSDLEE